MLLLTIAGAVEARVTSMSCIFPLASDIRLIIDPTSTASSTSDVISAGVETETSTPHDSLKSQVLRALLMRAITRGTANSCFASQLTTKLSSSSPVAAITTSTLRSPIAERLAYSHASAATTFIPGCCCLIFSATGFDCSINVTSW